mgnify:CR=1 FL=1
MNSKLVSLFCCLIMLVSFSGCTKVTQLVKDNQPTKADLLAEINEEHRRWEGGFSDPTPYLRHYDDPADAQKSTDYLTDTYSEYDAAKEAQGMLEMRIRSRRRCELSLRCLLL